MIMVRNSSYLNPLKIVVAESEFNSLLKKYVELFNLKESKEESIELFLEKNLVISDLIFNELVEKGHTPSIYKMRLL